MFMSYTPSAFSLRCVTGFNVADQHERSKDVTPRGLALRLKTQLHGSWLRLQEIRSQDLLSPAT